MVRKEKSDSLRPKHSFGLLDGIKTDFRLAVNTLRRTLFHPILLLWYLIVLGLSAFALFHFESLLKDHTDKTGLLQNIALITAALLALPLALSRTLTSERTLLNERYQKASEMLGSENIMVRIAAVYALERLSEERSRDYHVDIIKLICFFIRLRTAEKSYPIEPNMLSGQPHDSVGGTSMAVLDDVRAALMYLKNRYHYIEDVENAQDPKQIDLSHCNLTAFDLSNGDLSGTNCDDTSLANCDFSNTNLSKCSLANCSLDGTRLNNANLASVTGLRQRTLDAAIADEEKPPRLGKGDQVPVDPCTGRKLVWRPRR